MSVIKDYNEELYHYGVLGMKWGVRRGKTQKAYEKASKKLKKLDDKVNKAHINATTKARKAEIARGSVFSTRKYIERTRGKAIDAQSKYNKQLFRAERWYKQMEKTFAETDVKLTKEQKQLGKQFVDRIADRLEFQYIRRR